MVEIYVSWDWAFAKMTTKALELGWKLHSWKFIPEVGNEEVEGLLVAVFHAPEKIGDVGHDTAVGIVYTDETGKWRWKITSSDEQIEEG